MADTDQGKSELFGEGLPGTGGDFIDTGDVEGHKIKGGPYQPPRADGGPEGIGNDRYKGPRVDGTDEDVEGHLYRGGPSTQGEFAKRAPTDNPHGER